MLARSTLSHPVGWIAKTRLGRRRFSSISFAISLSKVVAFSLTSHTRRSSWTSSWNLYARWSRGMEAYTRISTMRRKNFESLIPGRIRLSGTRRYSGTKRWRPSRQSHHLRVKLHHLMMIKSKSPHRKSPRRPRDTLRTGARGPVLLALASCFVPMLL